MGARPRLIDQFQHVGPVSVHVFSLMKLIADDVVEMVSPQNVTNCTDNAPSAQEVISNLNTVQSVVVGIFILCTLATIANFIEEVIFTMKEFRSNRMQRERAKYIIYILGLYPVISIVGMVGFMIPRSSTVVDLVCETYVDSSDAKADAYNANFPRRYSSFALFAFVRLLILFMGGPPRLLQTINENPDARIVLRSPPCCCCCFCLPNIKVTRKSLGACMVLVLQLAFIRPALVFIAAVAWSNSAFDPEADPNTTSTYLNALNAISTLIAVYGMLRLKALLGPYLRPHRVTMKFVSLKLTILSTVIPALIINILSSNGLLPCTTFMSSKNRAARVNHCVLIILSLLLSILARFQFRIKEDAIQIEFGKGSIQDSKLEIAANDEDSFAHLHNDDEADGDRSPMTV
ncbi:hypothetical protein CAPTEDRAFT_219681 [Capitella teleta]|uniref:Uncharacterized protein n=1 Tax=Capitella teleta TaxID=283909 RepID=R7U541_CAPTE|nr:hypothetical protein CAPTEDRAFT_219681 [Capitella teleta]|eukprot:ELU01089.1 hypothetical protein CAPTEDRAFT_219681 [Capitella teleta]